MPLDRVYRTGGSSNLASYDFYDLSTGTGYKDFYLVDYITGAGVVNYGMTTNAVYSYRGHSTIVGTNVTLTFDITFEVPITINGRAFFQIPTYMTGVTPMTVEFTMAFYHYDGTTETQLGTTVSYTADGNPGDYAFTGAIEIDNQVFKAGDTFRLKLYQNVGGAPRSSSVFFDPKNRSTINGITTTFTQALVNLPIKIPR